MVADADADSLYEAALEASDSDPLDDPEAEASATEAEAPEPP
jgi:hypothetical protein